MLKDTLQMFITESASFYWEMAPYLVLGFIIAALIHILFPESFIMRHIGKSSLGSVIKSTLAGIPIPLCSCGVIPVAASLRKKGASDGAAVSFLIATPQIGADSYMITHSLISPLFALFRIIAAFITALLAGIATNILGGTLPPQTPSATIPKDATRSARIHSIFQFMQFELFGSIAQSLFVGILIAGAISAFIPASFFEHYLSNPFLSMMLMLVISIPMYVCATSSTPIAASLILKGISPGAALVFLLTGPATNAVTIATVSRVMGRKVMIIYLGSITIVSVLLGSLLNVIAVDTLSMIKHTAHHSMLPPWLTATGGMILTAMFCIHGFIVIKNRFFKKSQEAPVKEQKTIHVEGMTCMHCAANVKQAVEAVAGTSAVAIDLENKKVTFTFASAEISPIAQAVEDKGYQVVKETK